VAEGLLIWVQPNYLKVRLLSPTIFIIIKMKQLINKSDFKKEYDKQHPFFDGKLKVKDFIDSGTTETISSNLEIYKQLLSKEKKSIKLKYIYDRIENYNNYLKFLKDVSEKNITKPPLAFYSSTTNLINRGNYELRINYALNIFNTDDHPLFIFLEEPIFHSKKDFKITIIKERLVIDFNRYKFLEIKNNTSYWDRKIKRDIGSYIENLSFKNKEWIKERYYAVFDFIFKLILGSDSYEELSKKIATDCLLLEGFRGTISNQLDLINLLKNKVDFRELFSSKEIEIDITKCRVCGGSHVGPFRKDLSEKLPCGDLSWPIIFGSIIKFKKALLPFIALFYLNIVPILSNHNYLKNIKKFEPINKLDKGDIWFILNKIKFISLFKESMTYINLLAEGTDKDIYEIIKKWDNQNDIIIDNQNFYKLKNKQTDFVAIDKLKVSKEILNLIKKREKLRKLKKWQEADVLKTKLVYLGIDFIETGNKTLVREIA